MSEVKTMPRIKARSTFGSIVARAGLTRPELANAAGISARTIDALANPTAAHRHGYAREVTAWKIAKGFAKLTQQSDDDAFAQLFEGEVNED
jgi:DNA-binding XRE family transcriptional regulator